jgi:hypothetical protein
LACWKKNGVTFETEFDVKLGLRPLINSEF